MADLPASQIIVKILLADADLLLAFLDDLRRDLAAGRVNLFLQAADAGLHRIIRNDSPDGSVRKGKILFRYAGFLRRLSDQMLLRDMEFLIRRIARKLDNFHPVEQRLRDRIVGVCRADEEHMRQIVRQIDIVVRKGRVLLRIEHFQKRC